MVIAIYCRKSVYRDTSDSIGNQINMCQEFIQRNYGKDNTILIYDKDEGISGATTDRPCFRRLMLDVESGEIDMVVCYMIDRLSRNIKDFCNIYFTLQEHNCRFVSVKENIDDTTAMGRAMLYICQVFANLERDNIRERIKDNMSHIEQMGYWASGIAPFGYQCAKITIHGKKHAILQIDPEESKIYQQMVDLFMDQKMTLYGVETELSKVGIRSKKGAYLDSSRIWKYLSNPVYMVADQTAYLHFQKLGCQMMHPENDFDGKSGIMVRGRFRSVNGKMKIAEKNQWRIYVGTHKPLIPSHKWIDMQDRFQGNIHNKKKGIHGACSGILRCKCGYSMRSKSKKNPSTGSVYNSYICTRKDNGHRGECNAPMVKCSIIDDKVIDALREITISQDTLRRYISKDKPQHAVSKDDLSKNLKMLISKISRLTTSLADAEDSTASKYIIKEIEALDEQKMTINQKLTEYQLEELKENKRIADINTLYQDIRQLLSNIDYMDLAQKNEMLKSCVKEIIVSENEIEIIL